MEAKNWHVFLMGAAAVIAATLVRSALRNWLNVNL